MSELFLHANLHALSSSFEFASLSDIDSIEIGRFNFKKNDKYWKDKING